MHRERGRLARLGQVALQRRDNAAVYQRGWIDAARQVAQCHQRVSRLHLNFSQQLPSRTADRRPSARSGSQVDRQRDQMLLRAIMQVALDVPPLGILGGHDALARGA